MPTDLPAAVLQHIAASSGGQVVLITGAGCSMEPPTSLRSGGAYSRKAHDDLVRDRVLDEGLLDEPWDLSKLADLVTDVCGDQKELTDRLPRHEWQTATPNVGHRFVAALLIEGALRSVVTLNYDLALQVALSQLGNPSNVTIVKGPEDHGATSASSLVYLHRSASSPPESWILRKSDLDHAWKSGWEEFVARGALSAPVTVFAGLGSPAAVLTQSVATLAQLAGTSFFLADPAPTSAFHEALVDHLAGVVEIGWCDLARQLARRVAQEHVEHLSSAIRARRSSRSLSQPHADLAVASLLDLDLLALGQTRAAWTLHGKPYLRRDPMNDELFAESLLSVAEVATMISAQAKVQEHGAVKFQLNDRPPVTVRWAHALGMRTVGDVAARVNAVHEEDSFSSKPRVVVVDGAKAADPSPADLVRAEDRDDLIRGTRTTVAIDLRDLRQRHAAGAATAVLQELSA